MNSAAIRPGFSERQGQNKDLAPKGPVRVLRITTRLNIGGPTVHVSLLTRGLKDRGFETTLVIGSCSSEDGEAAYSADIVDHIIQIREMSRPLSPVKDAIALVRLVRLMRAYRPHIVHTHLSKAGVLGRLAALLAGVPVIVHTFHGNTLSEYFSPIANRIFRGVERALARWSDCICVVSEQQRNELTERFRIGSPGKVKVVPLGIELEPYLAVAPPPEATRRLTVGWLGRLVAVKNVPLLIKIILECVSRNMDVQFVIAGDGPERSQIEDLLVQIPPNRVRHLGWQTNVVAVLAQCDLLVQTSKNEGTPLALIQGMAAGRPFVSTAAGGVVDMVSGPGVVCNQARWFANAVLCDPVPGAFAETLQQLQSDPPRVRAMGRSARQCASRLYGGQRLLADVNDLYRALLTEKNADIPLSE